MELRQLIQKVARKRGYDIRRAEPRLPDFLQSRNIDTVVDVGANVGQFGQELRRIGYTGRIISFEPVAASFQALSQRCQADPQWEAHNMGLSDEEQTTELHVSEKSVFSSLHAITPSALEFDSGAAPTRVETIQLKRLDQFADKIAGYNVFLKIDTQGHERAVLQGAGQALDSVQGVQLELPISTLYKDTWGLGEGFDFMRQHGFVPMCFSPVNFHRADPMAMVEIDCIFRRLNPALD